MPRHLVVAGAGGFGRELLDVLDSLNDTRQDVNYELLGVADDEPGQDDLRLLEERRAPYLGDIRSVARRYSDAWYLVGIGSPSARRRVDVQMKSAGLVAARLVHSKAVIGSRSTVGPGTVICAGAQVSTNVVLESHVHINPGAIIGHDSHLGDYVSVNPGAIVSGRVTVADETLIGAGAIILQGLRIGSGVTIGAGAVVVRDVEDGIIVKGVPAR